MAMQHASLTYLPNTTHAPGPSIIPSPSDETQCSFPIAPVRHQPHIRSTPHSQPLHTLRPLTNLRIRQPRNPQQPSNTNAINGNSKMRASLQQAQQSLDNPRSSTIAFEIDQRLMCVKRARFNGGRMLRGVVDEVARVDADEGDAAGVDGGVGSAAGRGGEEAD